MLTFRLPALAGQFLDSDNIKSINPTNSKALALAALFFKAVG